MKREDIFILVFLLAFLVLEVMKLIKTLINPTQDNINMLNKYKRVRVAFRRKRDYQKHPATMQEALLRSSIYIAVLAVALLYFLLQALNT